MELVCMLALWWILVYWPGMQLHKLYIDAGPVLGAGFWFLVEKRDLLELACMPALWPVIAIWKSVFRCSVDEQGLKWCTPPWPLIDKVDMTSFLPVLLLMPAESMELMGLARMALRWSVKWQDRAAEEKGPREEAGSVNEEDLNWLAAIWQMFEGIFVTVSAPSWLLIVTRTVDLPLDNRGTASTVGGNIILVFFRL